VHLGPLAFGAERVSPANLLLELTTQRRSRREFHVQRHSSEG
jgi:hypothetical protein